MKEQDGIFEKYRGHTEPGGTKGSTLIQVKFLSADDSGGLASSLLVLYLFPHILLIIIYQNYIHEK